MEAKSKNIKLFVKLKPVEVKEPPQSFRDVSKIGRFGTGESEFTVSTIEEFEEIKKYLSLRITRSVGKCMLTIASADLNCSSAFLTQSVFK